MPERAVAHILHDNQMFVSQSHITSEEQQTIRVPQQTEMKAKVCIEELGRVYLGGLPHYFHFFDEEANLIIVSKICAEYFLHSNSGASPPCAIHNPFI